MAALQATNIAKAGNRSAPGGMTSASYFGGLSTHQSTRSESSPSTEAAGISSFSSLPGNIAHGPSPIPQTMNQAAMQQSQQRKRNFLHGLGSVMSQRGMPLPPQLTGVPYPAAFDPSTSPWRTLDVSTSDIGVVRLASKEIDLFKLWALVQQAGGSAKINEQGMWGQVLPHFDLPEQFMQPNGQAQATALALRHYYNNIIGPFEEAYRKNLVREQQQRASQNRTQGGMSIPGGGQGRPAMSGMPGTFPPVGTLPAMNGSNNSGMIIQTAAANALQPPDASLGGINGVQSFGSQALPQTQQNSQLPPTGIKGPPDARPLGSLDSNGIVMSQSDSNGPVPDLDGDGRKRKMEEVDESASKRARQRTGESSDPRGSVVPAGANGQPSAMSIPSRTRQPSRRKISYIPYAREVDTAGGRDLDAIQQEFAHAAQRPIKDLSDWGAVDIEALTMSVRSRISTEISYALTTFTIITLMRMKDASFPIAQGPDLFEELLDLVEDIAFDGPESVSKNELTDTPLMTHRQLTSAILEEGNATFAALKPKQGLKDPSSGPQQRRGDIVLSVTNIIRNLSLSVDNHEYMARHDRLLPLLLRLSSFNQSTAGSTPKPLSVSLSLNDVVTIRRDTVYTLINIANAIHLSSSPSSPSVVELLIARRAYELLSSFFIDPAESVGPSALVHLTGVSVHPSQIHTTKPPSIVDAALEVFTRLAHSDDNRLVFSKSIPAEWLWATFEALIRRLPVDNLDYQVLIRSEWLAYLERVMMSLYSVAFLAPPLIKKRAKTDRQLSFTKVMLRLIKKLSIYAPPDARVHFNVSLRRAVEALKLIDDAGDSFDSSPSTMPTLSFGMGYGEHGEARVEKGMGLLSGYQDEITWGVMTQRDVDDQTFAELVSLVRVEPIG